VLDEELRKPVAVSRDLAELQQAHAGKARAMHPAAPDKQTGTQVEALVDWTCGPLAEQVQQRAGRMQVKGFPALIDCGDHVQRRVLDSLPAAREAHCQGLRRLLMLREAKSARNLKKNIRNLQQMRLHYAKVPERDIEGKPATDLLDDIVGLAFERAFLDEPWTVRDADTFNRLREQGRPRLGPTMLEVSELAAGILAVAHDVRARLARTKQSNWQSSVTDMREQLDRLVYRGFLLATDWAHLQQLPRYLKAMGMRLDKLPVATARDGQLLEEMAPLAAEWSQRQSVAAARGLVDPRLEEIRWLLEELRVSLFAQSLKTTVPVSVKRIRKRWEALGL
jgi:ATP-dependent helicase HrpA